MGVVYKARQLDLDRLVALKMILADTHAGPLVRARFQTEAEAVARLDHPNIVRIHEVGEQAGRPYLVLEWIDGGTLAQHLGGSPLPGLAAAALLLPVAQAVACAHARGVVHRDLKPANILLRSQRIDEASGDAPPALVPKIADFGLAKRLDVEQGHTHTGAVMGTPNYRAPEQAASRTQDVGPLTDVYALGAILYEMLTGRPPFEAGSVMETLERVLTYELTPPSQFQPALDRDLEVICSKCLQKSPPDRYAGADALVADLCAYLDGEPIAARSLTALEKIGRAIRHRNYDDKVRPYSTTLFFLAPTCLLSHLAAYGFFHASASFPRIVTGVSAVTVVCLPVAILLAHPTVLRLFPPRQRRRFRDSWIANVIASALAVLLFWLTTPADQPERLLFVYPVLSLLAAQAFLSLADELGTYYVIGAGCCLVAALAAVVPFWAPLLIAVLASANLLAQGLYIRAVTSTPARR